MDINNISIFSIMMLLIPLVPIFIINTKFKLGINKGIVISIVRMGVQLTFVGIYLQYLFKFNKIFLNIGYVLIMIFIAAWSVIKSCKLPVKKLVWVLFISIALPHFIVLIYFNAFVARIDYIFNAKYLITVGGMLLGNSLRANIIALNTFYNTLKENKKEYTYTLALGASRYQALKPYLRSAVLRAVNPTIASMATIGLVSLPGMMTGQILGGSVPLTAIKYQIAIMIAIFIVIYFSVLTSLMLSQKVAFDEYDLLDIYK